MANTTWSTTDKAAGVTLSGGNLVASVSLGGASAIRGADKQITGKFYCEYMLTTGASNSVGVANSSVPIATSLGNSEPNSAILNGLAGQQIVNGVVLGTNLGARANGDVIGMALDCANALIWFRVAPSGNWNGSATANPATGVGGFSLSAIGPPGIPLYPFAHFSANSSSVTANFGGSTFSGTVPSGFTSGFTSGATPGNNQIVTQAAVEEWGSGTPAMQVTQVAIEEWGPGVPQAWVTQAGGSVWVTRANPPVYVTQAGASIWVDAGINAAYPLGVSATGGVGSVTIANLGVNASITGVETDTSLGNLSISISGSAAILGVETDTAIGSFAFELDTSITLTGVSSVGSAGIAIPEIDIAITGVTATTSVGILSTESTFLSGVAITTGLGIPTPANDVVVIVIGEQVNTGIGVIIPKITMPPLVEVKITGLPITASIGNVTPHTIIGTISGTISGGEITTGIGQPVIVSFIGGMAIDNLIVTQGVVIEEDTMVSLRWSDTDGNTWGDPVHRSLGLTGDYLNSLQWQRLGMCRHGRVFEIAWSAPVPTCLLGAHIRFDAARS